MATNENSKGAGKILILSDDDDKVVITIKLQERSSQGGGNTGGQPGQGPTATPFILIPNGGADAGVRPLPLTQAITNRGLQAFITNSDATGGWTDFSIQLSCIVSNLGAAVSATAVAEFYIGEQFGMWNPSHQTVTAAQIQATAQLVGRGIFRVPPGGTVTVMCPNLWTPGSSAAAQKGVLAQVYDLFTDPMTAPFDGFYDRHVARNDSLMAPLVNSVNVSGNVTPSGPKPLGSYAQSVTFTDVGTKRAYSSILKPGYQVFLPNPSSYLVAVTYYLGAGPRVVGPLTESIGSFNLNVNAASYDYDIVW